MARHPKKSNGLQILILPRNQFISGRAKPFSAKAGPMAVLSRPAPNGRFINAEAAKWPDIQIWLALISRPLGRLLMKMALLEACSCLCLDKTATGAGLDKTAIGPAFDELRNAQNHNFKPGWPFSPISYMNSLSAATKPRFRICARRGQMTRSLHFELGLPFLHCAV